MLLDHLDRVGEVVHDVRPLLCIYLEDYDVHLVVLQEHQNEAAKIYHDALQ